MTIRFSLFLLLFGFSICEAQIRESVVPLQSMPRETAQLKVTSLDTINLPILDDFSGKSTYPNQKYWSDNKVFINSTVATHLKSIGAATFDGTDEYGFPYNILLNTTDTIADVLTSQYINLKSNTNNVALSFMYQRGGLGEFPEQQDSLTVQFWSPQDSAWEQVWGAKGQAFDTTFRFATVPVIDPKHKQPGFRFRFASYGALNGAFDVWNIDYVELDSNRTPNDTLVQEPAFVRNHPFLTNNFNSIPWFHFNDNFIKDSLTIVYRRNGMPPPGGWPLNLGKYFILKDGVQIKDRLTVPVITNLVHNVDVNFKIPLKPLSFSPISGEFTIFMRTWFDGTAEGLRNNDTIEITIPFKNYYALDDGSAERAYGILNQTNARVAMQFQPLVPDSLKGLYINFAHAGVDATLNSFRIAIWRNNSGEPGLPLFISDSVYKPSYGFYHNDLIPFDLDTSIYIPGSVFIGLIQTKTDAIYIGMDANSTRTDKFYGDGFNWYQSLAKGNLLIRPYFKYTPTDISVDENATYQKAVVFPNPAKDIIYIKTEHADQTSWVLTNQMGQIIARGNGQELDVKNLSRGLYVLSVREKNQVSTHKIILN